MTGSVTNVPAGAESVETTVKVIRRDGTVEDIGRMAYWHKNPLKRLLGRLSVRRRPVPLQQQKEG